MATVKGDRIDIPGLELRGSTFFKIEDRSDPDNIKLYYVVYEDAKSPSLSCRSIKEAKTLLVFKRCDGCNSDYIYAADNIFSKKKCGSYDFQKQIEFPQALASRSSNFVYDEHHRKFMCSACSDGIKDPHCPNIAYEKCVRLVEEEVQTWDFIASAVNTKYDPCRYYTCRGHGQCKQIPSTVTHQCICEKNYEGESCEKRVDFDDSFENVISELRSTFNEFNGVPTAVDVFFSMRSLSKKLSVVLQKVKDSFSHTNNICQHSQIIYNVEDIADLYGKLQKNERTFYQFGQIMNSYLETVTAYQLQNRLKKMIPGQGALDAPGNDIYNSYKRQYVSDNGGGCSARYYEDIKSFRKSLAYLDQALAEALLLHQK